MARGMPRAIGVDFPRAIADTIGMIDLSRPVADIINDLQRDRDVASARIAQIDKALAAINAMKLAVAPLDVGESKLSPSTISSVESRKTRSGDRTVPEGMKDAILQYARQIGRQFRITELREWLSEPAHGFEKEQLQDPLTTALRQLVAEAQLMNPVRGIGRRIAEYEYRQPHMASFLPDEGGSMK